MFNFIYLFSFVILVPNLVYGVSLFLAFRLAKEERVKIQHELIKIEKDSKRTSRSPQR